MLCGSIWLVMELRQELRTVLQAMMFKLCAPTLVMLVWYASLCFPVSCSWKWKLKKKPVSIVVAPVLETEYRQHRFAQE